MNFKDKLDERPCFGTFLKIPRPEVVEVLALSGFDFVICDMEHAQISEAEARQVIKTAAALNMDVTVRLPDPSQGLVNRLLEAGATGIQIPRLKQAEDIRNLVETMKYPPYGKRSVGNANLLAGYGSVPLDQYLKSENERVVTIGQFETKEMGTPVEDLFEGLDVAFIGPVDLCVDFGQVGNLQHLDIQERINVIEEAAKRSNTTLGAFVPTVEAARNYLNKGYRYLAVSGDVGLLMSGAKNLIADLKEESKVKGA